MNTSCSCGHHYSPDKHVCPENVRVFAAVDAIARQFVIGHTRDGSCDCAIHNPSGRCCLKAFPGQ